MLLEFSIRKPCVESTYKFIHGSKNYCNLLKGQCQEIYCFWFFS
jgi:hypothetical protein